MTFALLQANILFSASLFVVALIFALELLGLLLGLGLLNALDSVIDFDLEASPVLNQTFSLFRVRKIPFSFLLVLFFLGFGLGGFFLNGLTLWFLGTAFPIWVTWLPTLILTIPFISISSVIIARFLPGDESSAVERSSFVGKIAQITLGTARSGSPAQAKLRDEHGQTHYVMVEPDNDEEWHTGDKIIILSQKGSIFIGFKDHSFVSEFLDN